MQWTLGSEISTDFYLGLYTCLYFKIRRLSTFCFLGKIKHDHDSSLIVRNMKKSGKDENKGEISKMLEVKLVDERNDARF